MPSLILAAFLILALAILCLGIVSIYCPHDDYPHEM